MALAITRLIKKLVTLSSQISAQVEENDEMIISLKQVQDRVAQAAAARQSAAAVAESAAASVPSRSAEDSVENVQKMMTSAF